MSTLTAFPGLPPEAIQQLASCGVDSMEMLAGLPAAEIHRVLELTAWQKGKLSLAPTLDMVHRWVETARLQVGHVDLPPLAEEIPAAVILPPPKPVPRRAYISPAQRARLAAAGPPVPAAALTDLEEIQEAIIIPAALPMAQPEPRPATALSPGPPVFGFNGFEKYQAGQTRVTPLSRHSLDVPGEHLPPERLNSNEEMSRTVRRGVAHPNPILLVVGALISLLWRAVLLVTMVGVIWLIFVAPKPSDYASEIFYSTIGLAILGILQLVVLTRARCRICSCHLFYSKDCVKNRKAHSLPLMGKVASLALHLLIFQWFRCMYCGTAIKLQPNKPGEE
jgi:hypothetical protein